MKTVTINSINITDSKYTINDINDINFSSKPVYIRNSEFISLNSNYRFNAKNIKFYSNVVKTSTIEGLSGNYNFYNFPRISSNIQNIYRNEYSLGTFSIGCPMPEKIQGMYLPDKNLNLPLERWEFSPTIQTGLKKENGEIWASSKFACRDSKLFWTPLYQGDVVSDLNLTITNMKELTRLSDLLCSMPRNLNGYNLYFTFELNEEVDFELLFERFVNGKIYINYKNFLSAAIRMTIKDCSADIIFNQENDKDIDFGYMTFYDCPNIIYKNICGFFNISAHNSNISFFNCRLYKYETINEVNRPIIYARTSKILLGATNYVYDSDRNLMLNFDMLTFDFVECHATLLPGNVRNDLVKSTFDYRQFTDEFENVAIDCVSALTYENEYFNMVNHIHIQTVDNQKIDKNTVAIYPVCIQEENGIETNVCYIPSGWRQLTDEVLYTYKPLEVKPETPPTEFLGNLKAGCFYDNQLKQAMQLPEGTPQFPGMEIFQSGIGMGGIMPVGIAGTCEAQLGLHGYDGNSTQMPGFNAITYELESNYALLSAFWGLTNEQISGTISNGSTSPFNSYAGVLTGGTTVPSGIIIPAIKQYVSFIANNSQPTQTGILFSPYLPSADMVWSYNTVLPDYTERIFKGTARLIIGNDTGTQISFATAEFWDSSGVNGGGSWPTTVPIANIYKIYNPSNEVIKYHRTLKLIYKI